MVRQLNGKEMGKKAQVKDASTGQFVKGGGGGPGRPKRETERAYLDVVRSRVSLTEWGEVVTKALEDAKAGDATARAWLSKFLIGDDPVAMLEVLDRMAALEAEQYGLEGT